MAHDEATRRRLESIDRAIEREAVQHRRSARLFWLLLLVPIAVAAWILWRAPETEESVARRVAESETVQANVKATFARMAPEVVDSLAVRKVQEATAGLERRLAALPSSDDLREVRERAETAQAQAADAAAHVEQLSVEQDRLRYSVERTMSANPSEEIRMLRARVDSLEEMLAGRQEILRGLQSRLGELERQNEETRARLLEMQPRAPGEPGQPEVRRIR